MVELINPSESQIRVASTSGFTVIVEAGETANVPDLCVDICRRAGLFPVDMITAVADAKLPDEHDTQTQVKSPETGNTQAQKTKKVKTEAA